MRSTLRIWAVISSWAWAWITSPAAASPLFELTGDASEQGGFSGRAGGSSAASTYFNPAQLPDAEPGAVLGVFLLNDQIGISLDGRNGGDVPTSYRGATHADGSVFEDVSIPTRWLREGCNPPECPLPLAPNPRQSAGTSHQTRVYQALALVVHVVPKRLALGFYGLLPLSPFASAHAFYADEREQFFTNSLHAEMYGDRLTAPSLALGMGGRLTKGVLLGAGITLNLHNKASAETFVGNPDDLAGTLILSTDVGVKVVLAPHFGVTVQPVDRIALSATLHTVQRFDIESGISTFLPDGNKQLVWRSTVHDYTPVRIGLGVRWDVISPGSAESRGAHTLSLTASGVFGFWSDYLDRHAESPSANYALSNTVNLTLGARYGFGRVRAFLDGAYVPSPFPLQTGRTNYVDNDRISTTGGVDYAFDLGDVRLRAGIQGQIHVLAERAQTKNATRSADDVRDEFPDDAVDSRGDPIAASTGLQTNNPGWPGFSSSGYLFGGGVNLALLF